MLFAQDQMPGWLSVVIQGGSFAVLAVLWLYLLPKMRKEIAEERKTELAGFMAHNEKQRVEFVAQLSGALLVFKEEAEQQREQAKSEMKEERLSCDKHFETLATSIAKGQEATIKAVQAMTEQGMRHAARNLEHRAAIEEEIKKEMGRREHKRDA